MSTRRHRLHLGASRLHKWLALIIGAQLLIWFASGALMSFWPIEEIHGVLRDNLGESLRQSG
jgi:uncharacterized iron-regulated membrane protein